jgi:hypothetical protein
MITKNRVVTITTCKVVLNGLLHPREGSTGGLQASTSAMFIVLTLCRMELKKKRCGEENPG